MPATKSLRSGTWASTLLPMSEVGRAGPRATSARGQLAGRRTRSASARPGRSAASATLRAGSTPSAGMPACDEVLQQVAVVAGQLDDVGCRAQAEAGADHRLDVAPRVLDPAVGVRREVGVLGEDLLAARRTPAAAPGSTRGRPGRGAGRTAPSRRAGPAARKLSHSGDMPRSTKVCVSAAPQKRQRGRAGGGHDGRFRRGGRGGHRHQSRSTYGAGGLVRRGHSGSGMRPMRARPQRPPVVRGRHGPSSGDGLARLRRDHLDRLQAARIQGGSQLGRGAGEGRERAVVDGHDRP